VCSAPGVQEGDHRLRAGVFDIDLEISLREAREALARVASGHTRGKIVLQVGQ
jgi:hypothetical protein